MPPDNEPTEACSATLHFFGFSETEAHVTVARHAHAARLKRALLALGTWWGVGLLCVLIPIAHFVLVPAFFVLGIVLFVKRLGERASIVGVTGTCPRCKSGGPFIASGRLKIESKAQCEACRNELDLKIEPACVEKS